MRLQLHVLAYNRGNLLRTLALLDEVEHWSMTTLREKLIKIGAKVIGTTRSSLSRSRFHGGCSRRSDAASTGSDRTWLRHDRRNTVHRRR